MLWVALQFSVLPPGALERLAAWACQFTPRVSLEPPQALLAEVQGSLRLFEGTGGLLERMRAGLAALGCEASIAVAGTPRAALWRARDGNKPLEEVRVDSVCDEKTLLFLKSLGVSTIGELLALPREGLGKRCGNALLRELDRARGALAEPRAFFSPPASFDATLELPAAVSEAEGVLFAARRLLAELEGLLAARQEGTRSFVLQLMQHKNCVELQVPLASPARSVERFTRLLREKLSTVVLREPVEAIRLRSGAFSSLHPSSAGFFGDARAEAEAWAQLAERLRARLGDGALHGLTVQPDHRPEHAWRAVEPGEWDPREFVQPGPRPVWLLREPRRLAQPAFELLAGPERIECGWWDGDDARRDYFIAQMADASLAWIYRERSGDWYLHGLFA